MMRLFEELCGFMKPMAVEYAVCGGYAVDLFLNRATRRHKDLDVSVLLEDRDAIVASMLELGWDVYEPCGCAYLHKIDAVHTQMKVKTNIWCVRPGNPAYRFTQAQPGMYAVTQCEQEQTRLDFIEFLFNTVKDGNFLYAKNHNIQREMRRAVLQKDGVPFLAPELVLLYKAAAVENKAYQQDFCHTLPRLKAEPKRWLKHALQTVYPAGHMWLQRL